MFSQANDFSLSCRPAACSLPQRVPHATLCLVGKTASLPPALPSQANTDPSPPHLPSSLSAVCLFFWPTLFEGAGGYHPAGTATPQILRSKRRQPWGFVEGWSSPFPLSSAWRVKRGFGFRDGIQRFKEAHSGTDQHHYSPRPLIGDYKCTKITTGRDSKRR